MANKLFIDTNILLDHYLKRPTFSTESTKLLNDCVLNEYQLFTDISCVQTSMYIIIKSAKINLKVQKQILQNFYEIFEICQTDKIAIKKAIESDFKDLEDAILYFTAEMNNIDYFVTRNIKDYPVKASPEVVTPDEAINILF
ncbi:MAG: hypothetical protein DSY77_11065 [Bacteroidetes bacterium]|nr:MAG: hypothetical protein DSY77_11065 [Bacteroidota bacterium]